MRRSGPVGFAFALLIPLSAVVQWLLFRRAGGERFRRHGFVLCPDCGWIRSGEEEGASVADARRRGFRLFARILVMFAFPILWFLGFSLVRADAAFWFLLLMYAAMPGILFFHCFRPQKPPRHLRRSPVLRRLLRHVGSAGADRPAAGKAPEGAPNGRNVTNVRNGVPE